MSSIPPNIEPVEVSTLGEIKVLLQWIRQDTNGILEQQRITNGRMNKAEDRLTSLELSREEDIKLHKEYSEGIKELANIKAQLATIVSLLKYGGGMAALLTVAKLLYDFISI